MAKQRAETSPALWWALGIAVVAALAYAGRKPIGDAVDTLTGAAKARALLLAELVRGGAATLKEKAMFLAQVHHESAGFRRLEESFAYSSPAKLMAVSASAKRAGEAAVAAALKAGPASVAQIMYGGRMGNTAPGDAYKYRGRGYIQLTGRENYTTATRALGIDLVNKPEQAATPEIAAKIAAWYWRSRVGGVGASGDVTAVTKLINGGTIGLADRQELYQSYLKDAEAGKLA